MEKKRTVRKELRIHNQAIVYRYNNLYDTGIKTIESKKYLGRIYTGNTVRRHYFKVGTGEKCKRKQDIPCTGSDYTEKEVLIGIAQIFVVKARRGTFLHIRHGPVWKEYKVSIGKS